MSLVDTHCHIQSIGQLTDGEPMTRDLWRKAGDLTPDQVIEEAQAAGVNKLICVGCDLEDSQLAIKFSQDRQGCWASIGIHPHEAGNYVDQNDKLELFSSLSKEKKVVAVGECGLDFYYNHSSREDQIKILKYQIELALSSNLPLIFHVREAFDDFWPILNSYKDKVRGVLHSFTDNKENLAKAVDYGLFIGVNGIATFAKNPDQLEVYKAIPLQNLLLETDSPFLTPIPYRGTINQPKRVVNVANFLAELRVEDIKLLADATSSNAQTLFGL